MDNKISNRTLGYDKHSLSVFPIGLGCMGMSEFYGEIDHEEAKKTICLARELGINLFDTSDMYGYGKNEQLLKWLINQFGREEILISTKGGVKREKKDKSSRIICGEPKYLRSSCHESLKRLGTDYIDLYFLQRVDPKIPVEESMGALAQLVKEGKIKCIGLSEVDGNTIKRANVIHPITAIQSEYSLCTKKVETNGVLDICFKLNIGFMPTVPLCRGLLTGKIKAAKFDSSDIRLEMPRFQGGNLRHNLKFISNIEKMALAKKCTAGQLAIAWLLAKNKNIVPIPGTKKRVYLLENIKAIKILNQLKKEDIDYLDKISTEIRILGSRGTQSAMKAYAFKE